MVSALPRAGCMTSSQSLALSDFSFCICKVGLIVVPPHRAVVRITWDSPFETLKRGSGT